MRVAINFSRATRKHRPDAFTPVIPMQRAKAGMVRLATKHMHVKFAQHGHAIR